MTWILSLLAFALIFTAVMNYILIVISSIVNRSKEVAVHKCYGASENNIHGMMFGEALVHIVLSLILALLLILAFRGTVEELLATSLDSLLLSNGSLVLLGICILVFFVSGFMRDHYTPDSVASAFRNYGRISVSGRKPCCLSSLLLRAFGDDACFRCPSIYVYGE